MSKSIFSKRWFFNQSHFGVEKSLYGTAEEESKIEYKFFSNLIINILNRQREGDLQHADLWTFFGFCQRMLDSSLSQIYQDLWVLYMLAEKKEGYFVEFGACDGVLLSNTILLEKSYGWTGILAEPNPAWYKQLTQSRNAICVSECVSHQTGDIIEFLITEERPELSRIAKIVPDDVHERNGNRDNVKKINVSTISLLDLLREQNAPKVIDYLSIDTEGSEYEILKNFDFSAYSFRLITVEHAGESEKRQKIQKLLEGHNYTRWHTSISRWDDWYIGPNYVR